jgi:hypothetical protein
MGENEATAEGTRLNCAQFRPVHMRERNRPNRRLGIPFCYSTVCILELSRYLVLDSNL